jgi:hypothetical protein
MSHDRIIRAARRVRSRTGISTVQVPYRTLVVESDAWAEEFREARDVEAVEDADPNAVDTEVVRGVR